MDAIAAHRSRAILTQSIARDLRYAVRSLLRRPLFSATAVLSLAVGIGTATAVYSWGSYMFFRPPTGVPDPHSLVAVYLDDRDPQTEPNILSLPHYDELRTAQTVFTDMGGAFRYWASLSAGPRAQEVTVEFVTGTFFSTVRTPMLFGRGIVPEDDVPGGPLSAVVSHALWQSAFGGAADILGRTLRLNGRTFTIVGVAPREFEGVDYSFYGEPDLWAATHTYTPVVGTNRVTRRSGLLRVVARLRPGVTVQSAEAALAVPGSRLSHEPTDYQQYTTVRVVPIHQARIPIYTRATIGPSFAILLVVTALMLAAACFNVATFLISQGIARKSELGVRMALGATRRQVFQQLVVESLVLGGAAGCGGLIVAVICSQLLQVPAAINVGTALETPTTIDFRAGVFAWVITLLATLAFGVLPAALTSQRNPVAGAAAGGTYWSTSRGFRLRQALLALQISLAVALTVVAVLHVRSFMRIQTVAHPYATNNVLLARINATSLEPERRSVFYRDLLGRLRATPGVVGAALSSTYVLSPGGARVHVAPDSPEISADYVTAGSGYFAGLGVPLQAGREFHESDRAGAAIVNVTLAAQLWPGENPIGRSIRLPGIGPRNQVYTILGVSAESRCRDMSRASPCVYLPVETGRPGPLILYVRTPGTPASFVPVLNEVVRAMSADVVVDRTSTFEEHLDLLRTSPRLAASITAATAILATVLCAIGCAALLFSLVREAQREIAIRLALGSAPGQLTRHIMLRAITPSAAGIAAGLAVAWFVAARVGDQLYETSVHEPAAFVAPALLLLFVVTCASFAPTRLALRTSPARLLRGAGE
jgi:predicted permease